MKNGPLILLFNFLTILTINSQNEVLKEFNLIDWDISSENYELKEFNGKESLYLENGIALLKNEKLKNGIIDFYMSFTDSRKFISFYFRSQDSLHYERFYLRPHQAGNIDATQYTPVINGLSAWQLYYGKGYSQPYYFNFKEWNHLRFVINNKEMDVYINDMSKPVLEVYDLKYLPKQGGMGIGISRGGAYFANFSYKIMENPTIFNTNKEIPKTEQGTITEWKVSSAFDKKQIDKVNYLSDLQILKNLNWQILKSEYSGTINLAQISVKNDSVNTVLAKIKIRSDKKQIVKLDFGYNDFARIYVNNKIEYSGYRTFRSRDYRYLGTIGYFESIFLDLKKGDNEVVFSISEDFGGWGLKAKIENLEGIKLNRKL